MLRCSRLVSQITRRLAPEAQRGPVTSLLPETTLPGLKTSRSYSRRLPIIEHEGRVFDIYSRLLQDRIVCLHGPIDDDSSANIVAQLLYLESTEPSRPISMYINSSGGVVTSGLAIYDTMQYISSPVSTLCVGQACSMAAVLLAGGEPGMRGSLPNSRIMIHQPSGGYQGTAADIAISAQEILDLRARLNELMANHTKNDISKIEVAMERDNFMTPTAAKEFGIIDNIMSSNREAKPEVKE